MPHTPNHPFTHSKTPPPPNRTAVVFVRLRRSLHTSGCATATPSSCRLRAQPSSTVTMRHWITSLRKSLPGCRGLHAPPPGSFPSGRHPRLIARKAPGPRGRRGSPARRECVVLTARSGGHRRDAPRCPTISSKYTGRQEKSSLTPGPLVPPVPPTVGRRGDHSRCPPAQAHRPLRAIGGTINPAALPPGPRFLAPPSADPRPRPASPPRTAPSAPARSPAPAARPARSSPPARR